MPHTSHIHAVEDKILKDPAAFFDKPSDVLHSERYSNVDKCKILMVWKEQAEALQRATGEGMGGGEPSHIEAVAEALGKLKKVDEPER